jgi:hypothetical protein
MEVAFWELAPYFPEASVEYLSTSTMEAYVRNNAGKASEVSSGGGGSKVEG